MAAETLGNGVFDAVVGSEQPLARATNLAAIELALLELAEVLLEPGQAISAQGRGTIDVAQAPGRIGLGTAQDHSPLDLLRPGGQPVAAALGALAELFPFGELDDRPLHHGVVLDPGPGGALAAGARR